MAKSHIGTHSSLSFFCTPLSPPRSSPPARSLSTADGPTCTLWSFLRTDSSFLDCLLEYFCLPCPEGLRLGLETVDGGHPAGVHEVQRGAHEWDVVELRTGQSQAFRDESGL